MARRKKKSALGAVILTILIFLVIAAAVFGVTFALSRLVHKEEQEEIQMTYPKPEPYRETVEKYAAEYDIPAPVLYAVIRTESAFDPNAVSPVGAMGLMQMMPSTFTWLQPKLGDADLPADALFDPDVSVRYGAYLLRMLYDEFGEWETVWAAYNAGINRVRGWLKDPAIAQDGRLVNIPIEETANYVIKVRDALEHYNALYPETGTQTDQNLPKGDE